MTEEDKTLLEQFRIYAIKHGEGIRTGNYRRANSSHDRLMSIVQTLRQRDIIGTPAMLALLEDGDPSVRFWTASRCLTTAAEHARPVLEALAQDQGIVAFEAEMVLELWEKGELNIF